MGMCLKVMVGSQAWSRFSSKKRPKFWLVLVLPGLVNVYITNWKIIMLFMGQLTISMAIFQFAFCMFTRSGIAV